MIVALILVAAAIVAWFIRDDRHELARFKVLTDSAARRSRYAFWIAKAFVIFMVSSLAGLALIGRLDALVAMPPEFARLAALAPQIAVDDRDMMVGLIVGALFAGGVLGGLLARRRSAAKPVMLGDIAAILPRNRAELAYGALLSLNAGVTEEVFFRLFVPLLLTLATGDALIAFAAATIVFGLVHLYQGVAGVLGSTLLGAVLAVLYLATGSLWVAVAAHVLIDLNGLVLRPAIGGAWRA